MNHDTAQHADMNVASVDNGDLAWCQCACGSAVQIPAEANEIGCIHCGKDFVIAACRKCGIISLLPKNLRARKVNCTGCNQSSLTSLWIIRTGAAFAKQFPVTPNSVGCRVDGIVISSTNFHILKPNHRIALLFRDSDLLVIGDAGTTSTIDFRDILEVSVGGPGEESTNAGIGVIVSAPNGGGITGMLEAAQSGLTASIFADAINRVTTQTTITTLLRVVTRDSAVLLQTDRITPENLDVQLAPFKERIRRTRGNSNSSSVPQIGIADEIMKLVELQKAGHITAGELIAAKTQLLTK